MTIVLLIYWTVRSCMVYGTNRTSIRSVGHHPNNLWNFTTQLYYISYLYLKRSECPLWVDECVTSLTFSIFPIKYSMTFIGFYVYESTSTCEKKDQSCSLVSFQWKLSCLRIWGQESHCVRFEENNRMVWQWVKTIKGWGWNERTVFFSFFSWKMKTEKRIEFYNRFLFV